MGVHAIFAGICSKGVLQYLGWGAKIPRIFGMGVPKFLTPKGYNISQGGA